MKKISFFDFAVLNQVASWSNPFQVPITTQTKINYQVVFNNYE